MLGKTGPWHNAGSVALKAPRHRERSGRGLAPITAPGATRFGTAMVGISAKLPKAIAMYRKASSGANPWPARGQRSRRNRQARVGRVGPTPVRAVVARWARRSKRARHFFQNLPLQKVTVLHVEPTRYEGSRPCRPGFGPPSAGPPRTSVRTGCPEPERSVRCSIAPRSPIGRCPTGSLETPLWGRDLQGALPPANYPPLRASCCVALLRRWRFIRGCRRRRWATHR